MLRGKLGSIPKHANWRLLFIAIGRRNVSFFRDEFPRARCSAEHNHGSAACMRYPRFFLRCRQQEIGAKMPCDLKIVDRSSLYYVTDQPILAVHVKDRPAMNNRIRKPCISVVVAGKEIESWSGNPLFIIDLRQPTP